MRLLTYTYTHTYIHIYTYDAGDLLQGRAYAQRQLGAGSSLAEPRLEVLDRRVEKGLGPRGLDVELHGRGRGLLLLSCRILLDQTGQLEVLLVVLLEAARLRATDQVEYRFGSWVSFVLDVLGGLRIGGLRIGQNGFGSWRSFVLAKKSD